MVLRSSVGSVGLLEMYSSNVCPGSLNVFSQSNCPGSPIGSKNGSIFFMSARRDSIWESFATVLAAGGAWPVHAESNTKQTKIETSLKISGPLLPVPRKAELFVDEFSDSDNLFSLPASVLSRVIRVVVHI